MENRSSYRVLVWTPEGKRPLEQPRRKWEDNIKVVIISHELDLTP
jgi:hypothetical protein